MTEESAVKIEVNDNVANDENGCSEGEIVEEEPSQQEQEEVKKEENEEKKEENEVKKEENEEELKIEVPRTENESANASIVVAENADVSNISDDGEISEPEEKVEKSSKREKKSEKPEKLEKTEKTEKKDKKKHKSSKHRRRSRSRSPHRHHRRSRSSSPVNPSDSSKTRSLSPIRHSRSHNGHSNGRSKHQNNDDNKPKAMHEVEKELRKNPTLLNGRCQQVIQIGENQAAQISDDELRKCIKEAVALVAELDKHHGKRELLKDELKDMTRREIDLIKKIHSELPRHMQSVLRVDGNSVHISQERTNGVFPPFGMMPPPPFGMPGLMGMPPPDVMPFPPPFPPIPGMFPPPPNFHMGPPPPFLNNRPPMPNLMQPPPQVPSPGVLDKSTPPPPFNGLPPIPQGGFPDFSKPPPIPPLIEKPIAADASKENKTGVSAAAAANVPTSNAAPTATPAFRSSDMAEKSNKLTSMLTSALKAHVTQREQSPFGNGSPSSSQTPPTKPAATSLPSLMSVPIREPPNLVLQRGIAATRKRLMDDD